MSEKSVAKHSFVIGASGACVYEVDEGQFCGAPREAEVHTQFAQRDEILEAVKAYGRAMKAGSDTANDKLNAVRDLLDRQDPRGRK